MVQDHLSRSHDLAVEAEGRGRVPSEGHHVASCIGGMGEGRREEREGEGKRERYRSMSVMDAMSVVTVQ